MKIVFAVGTDHHPFDRACEWASKLSETHDVWIQHGTSELPQGLNGSPLLSRDQLLEKFAEADVVVTHGGPSTIMDAMSAGRRPVVMARNPKKGEHVDDHQMRFAEFMHEQSRVISVGSYDDLVASLESDRSPIEVGSESEGLGAFIAIASKYLN